MDANNSATAVTSTSGPDSPPSSSSCHIMHHHPHAFASGHPLIPSTTTAAAALAAATASSSSSTTGSNFTDDGLVVPRKLVNPCLESRERIDLHRELRFNVKALVAPSFFPDSLLLFPVSHLTTSSDGECVCQERKKTWLRRKIPFPDSITTAAAAATTIHSLHRIPLLRTTSCCQLMLYFFLIRKSLSNTPFHPFCFRFFVRRFLECFTASSSKGLCMCVCFFASFSLSFTASLPDYYVCTWLPEQSQSISFPALSYYSALTISFSKRQQLIITMMALLLMLPFYWRRKR